MKKNILIGITILFITIFISFVNVHAATHYSNTTKSVEAGKAVLLCEYKSNANEDGLRIYYHFEVTGSTAWATQRNWWDVFTSKAGAKWSDITNGWTNETLSYGSFLDVFSTSTRIHYNKLKGRLTNESTFKCPQYGYLDYDANNEVCLSENGNCDTSKFDRPQMTLLTTSDTIFNVINKYAAVDVYSELTYQDVKNNTNLKNLLIQKTTNFVKTTYTQNGYYVFPQFLTNYINNLDQNIETSKIPGAEEAFEDFQEDIKEEVQQEVEDGTISEEEAEVIIDVIQEQPWASVKGDLGGGDFKDPSTGTDCEALLTPSFAKVLNNILTFVQYLGPVLVGIFSLLDYLKVVFSGDQDEIKKVSKKFMKRVVAAILLFMIPIIVNLVFSLTGVIPPQNCFN